jgi:hypothetical protein
LTILSPSSTPVLPKAQSSLPTTIPLLFMLILMAKRSMSLLTLTTPLRLSRTKSSRRRELTEAISLSKVALLSMTLRLLLTLVLRLELPSLLTLTVSPSTLNLAQKHLPLMLTQTIKLRPSRMLSKRSSKLKELSTL